MATKVRFTKMHGAGNDYIYVNTLLYNIADPAKAAIEWSKPHTGIGSDGLVLIGPSPVPEADFSMRIFNADGSEAMMCGNASRCIGKYLYERGLTDQTEIRLLTLSGIKTLLLNTGQGQPADDTEESTQVVESVTVDMGEPVFENERLFAPKNGQAPTLPRNEGQEDAGGCFVSMGNPHYVLFTADVDRVAVDGPALERHPAFPERCNIEFAHVLPDGRIRMRVWERGSGVTMACGTGACATAVAAMRTKRTDRSATVIMDGGSLDIRWNESDGHVYMTGPAAFVFDGEIEI